MKVHTEQPFDAEIEAHLLAHGYESASSADMYRAEISELEKKEDRLFDRFDAEEIDRETYDRQLKRIRTEKATCFEKLRETDSQEDEKYLVTADRVLELARRAKSLWDGREPSEKRDFVARLVCNPRLDGRTVRFDLRKPFDVIAKIRRDDEWRPYLEEFRTARVKIGVSGGLSVPRST